MCNTIGWYVYFCVLLCTALYVGMFDVYCTIIGWDVYYTYYRMCTTEYFNTIGWDVYFCVLLCTALYVGMFDVYYTIISWDMYYAIGCVLPYIVIL